MAGRLLNLRPWMVGLHLQAGPGSRYWLFLLRMQEITDKRKGNVRFTRILYIIKTLSFWLSKELSARPAGLYHTKYKSENNYRHADTPPNLFLCRKPQA